MLHVLVRPRAGRNAIVGRHGSALKLRVAAPPTEGRANDAVVALLAETLGVKVGAVRIRSGAGSRSKRVEVAGVSVTEAAARLGLVAPGTSPAPGRR